MNFAQVEAKFKELKKEYEVGAITEEELKAQLEDLMIQDDEGRWWMIGYETGQWYYYDGEKWVQAEPPKPAPTAPPMPVVELQRVRKLFREEGFLLHFLPTVVAGGVWWFVSKRGGVFPWGGDYWRYLEYAENRRGFAGGNILFAVVAAFLLWLVLHTRVTRRWQMMLALAASWEAASRLTILLDFITYGTSQSVPSRPGYVWLITLPNIVGLAPAFEVAIIFALGLGFSFLFARTLGAKWVPGDLLKPPPVAPPTLMVGLQHVRKLFREGSFLLITVGWGISWVIGPDISLDDIYRLLRQGSIDYVTCGAISGAIVGTMVGLITGLALRRTEPSFQWKQVLTVAIGWAVGWAVGWAIGWAIGWNSNEFQAQVYRAGIIGYWPIHGAIAGAIGGLITGLALRWTEPSLQWKQVVLVAIGCAIGWAISGAIWQYIFVRIVMGTRWAIVWDIARATAGAIAGAIGGGVMFWQLSRAPGRA